MARSGFSYYLGSSGFSIYEEMATLLDKQGNWKRQTNESRMLQVDVLLSDRFAAPYHLLRERRSTRKILLNYFRGSHRLTLKAAMAKLLRDLPGSEVWLPRTLVLSAKPGVQDERATLHEMISGTTSWIVKPSAGCKGDGILLSRHFESICSYVDASPNTVFVVQQYIDKPLLLNGRKFDVRVWALLSHPYNIYVFDEGSCRTTSVEYSESFDDALAHLTNHCLQEKGENYGKFEPGNELWFADLDLYLKKNYPSTPLSDIVKQFHQIIIETLTCVRDLIEVKEEPFECFQLFGYDFLVQENGTVMLLEINGSPGSANKFLFPLVAGILKIEVEPRFGPLTLELQRQADCQGRWQRVFPLSE